MFGQKFIDKCVIGGQQLRHIAILFDDVVKEKLCLAHHRIQQISGVVQKLIRVRLNLFEVSKVQPLAGKVVGQRDRFGIGQHAACLFLQHRRILELTLGGEI